MNSSEPNPRLPRRGFGYLYFDYYIFDSDYYCDNYQMVQKINTTVSTVLAPGSCPGGSFIIFIIRILGLIGHLAFAICH